MESFLYVVGGFLLFVGVVTLWVRAMLAPTIRLRQRLLSGELRFAGVALITESCHIPMSEPNAWEGVADSLRLVLQELAESLTLPKDFKWMDNETFHKGVWDIPYDVKPTKGKHQQYVDRYLQGITVPGSGLLTMVIWRDGTFYDHRFQWRVDFYNDQMQLVHMRYVTESLPWMSDPHYLDDDTLVESEPRGLGKWGTPLLWGLLEATKTRKQQSQMSSVAA